jgi:serine/threonine protein kinase
MAAAPSPSSDEFLEIGSVLDGRYRIDGVIGGGGMARVYRAEHLGIGRSVAIKVLYASQSRSREAVTRFQREAITSGRLEHPNIVAVTDSGMLHDGRCFLVMESLDGETLADRLAREGRLPWRAALALVRGIVVGLRHAHDHGVIHRDIKPDNIFVLRRDEDPLVKILDFGIAKLQEGAASDTRITQRGLTVGSPTYMSPEQAVDGEITPASDLYSTTVVLFEMLAGRTPFDRGDPVATMKAHISMPPPTLRDMAPEIDLPHGLEEIVQRGLAKSIAERIGSAGKLLGMLDRICAEAAASHVRGSRPATAPEAASPSGWSELATAERRPDSDQHTGRAHRRQVERTMLVRARSRTRAPIIIGSMAFTLIAVIVGYLALGSKDHATVASNPVTSQVAADASNPVTSQVATDAASLITSEPHPAALADQPTTSPDAASEDDVEIDMEDEAASAATRSAPGSAGSSTTKEKKRDRDQAKQWIAKGNADLKAGKFDEATTSFQRALAANRNAHGALAGLAEVAYNRADFSGAVLTAKRAVALAPARVGYRMTLAKSYYKIMRYEDAVQQWRKVLELDPTNTSAQNNIEMAQSKTGR